MLSIRYISKSSLPKNTVGKSAARAARFHFQKISGTLKIINNDPCCVQVGRLLQPSVIFVDQAEKTFLKKVSKTDKSDPKRLKKDLPKLVKGIAPEDQVS